MRRVSTPRRAGFGKTRLESDDGDIASDGSGFVIKGQVVNLEVAAIGRVLVTTVGVECDQNKVVADGLPLSLGNLVGGFIAEDTSEDSSNAIINVGDIARVIENDHRRSIGSVKPGELVSLAGIYNLNH